MNALRVCHVSRTGFWTVSPAERACFGILSTFATTVGIARAINYVLERRRHAPRLRSWARRAYHAPGQEDLRVHHFVPGIGLAFSAGAAAILTRGDGREFWLSLPFGTGAGLTLDEIGLLVKADNPYWNSENLALVQALVGALGAAALAGRFYRRGTALIRQVSPEDHCGRPPRTPARLLPWLDFPRGPR